MKYILTPQIREGTIEYEIEKDIIKAIYEDEEDTFDFTDLPDGDLLSIETNLKINPIQEASKREGVLSVKLLNLVSEEATEDELYPEWNEVE